MVDDVQNGESKLLPALSYRSRSSPTDVHDDRGEQQLIGTSAQYNTDFD